MKIEIFSYKTSFFLNIFESQRELTKYQTKPLNFSIIILLFRINFFFSGFNFRIVNTFIGRINFKFILLLLIFDDLYTNTVEWWWI